MDTFHGMCQEKQGRCAGNKPDLIVHDASPQRPHETDVGGAFAAELGEAELAVDIENPPQAVFHRHNISGALALFRRLCVGDGLPTGVRRGRCVGCLRGRRRRASGSPKSLLESLDAVTAWIGLPGRSASVRVYRRPGPARSDSFAVGS